MSTMKRFDSNKVRALGNLQGRTDKQKSRDNAYRGVKQRFAIDDDGIIPPSNGSTVVRVRDYLAPVKASYVPPKLRGRSGTRLSEAKRAMVIRRGMAREAFFASLRSGLGEV